MIIQVPVIIAALDRVVKAMLLIIAFLIVLEKCLINH